MSTPLSIDAYDAQMLDFSSDPDVPMHITASADFFAEALMDHDGHLDTSAYGEHASVEVDMEEYIGDNAEYEMADETADYQRSHGGELLDIEVFDASHAPSPLVPPQPLQPPVDVPIDSEHLESSSAFLEPAALPELPSEPELEVDSAPSDCPAADAVHVETAVTVEGVSLDPTYELAHSVSAHVGSVVAISETHEQLGDSASVDGQTLDAVAPVGTTGEEDPVPPVVEEPATGSEVTQHENAEPPLAESALPTNTEDAHDSSPSAQVEKAVDQEPAAEGETVDPLRISDGVYIDPPPAVLLSIANLSEPEFALFNQPEVESELGEEAHDDQKVYSLLLESRPTLYYEPLSSVFEVFRQDEDLLSRIPNSFEGELILDAYDLQLSISEDNIHSREISLHDLNILHDGSDFAGPLRLLIRTNTPRFIIRFYALQEQIQRLNVTTESGEGEHGEEHHEHYDISGEQPRSQQQATGNSSVAVTVSERSTVTEDREQPIKEPATGPEPSRETEQENYEPDDTSATQEPPAEYHEATGEAVHVPEDENENDYEGTNASGDNGSAQSENLDADQVHETAAQDTNASATVTGQESEFGGEQTEYVDYVQPEEYDERYGEDLSVRDRDASAVQYDGPPHHEEEEEQDSSTVVNESQVALPGSDDDEEESLATPIPAPPVLESEFAYDNASDEPALAKQQDVPTSSHLAASASAKEVRVVPASGNEEPSMAQAKIFSKVEESDSNFVSMLEREADAEFDQSFNPEQNGQVGSVESVLQHEEAWDEWDDEDAEGVDEEDWIEPDAVSNESSITLSSKASSKRSYDEVEPSEEFQLENSQSSPAGSKRPRVE